METYTRLRKQNYSDDLRGKYVRFVEHIHDIVRAGEVERLSAPLSVYWAITGRCNLKCTHCYASDLRQNYNVEVDIDMAKRIVDLLYGINIADLVLEGGEPTLYDDFIELIQYIKNNDIPLTLITNATALSDEIIHCINTWFGDYDMVQVSIDGGQKSCDAIRGEGVYEKVISAIRKLKVHIVVNCVVTIETIKHITELCDVLFGIPNIRTLHLSPVMKTGKGVFHHAPSFEEAQTLLCDLRKKYGDWISGTAIADSIVLSQNKNFLTNMKKIKLGCCAGRSKMYIDESGRVYSCEFLKHGDGIDLFDKGFDIIWKESWNEQAKEAKNISLHMNENGEFIPFCYNMEIYDGK